MKIDDREDALAVAQDLIKSSADADAIADSLLEAHLEGIEQARSQFLQNKSYKEIANELNGRRDFLLTQIPR